MTFVEKFAFRALTTPREWNIPHNCSISEPTIMMYFAMTSNHLQKDL